MIFLRFDYLKTDDPIFVITEGYSDAIDLIKRYREHSIEIKEISEICKVSIRSTEDHYERIFETLYVD